jgi:hypothetical protein
MITKTTAQTDETFWLNLRHGLGQGAPGWRTSLKALVVQVEERLSPPESAANEQFMKLTERLHEENPTLADQLEQLDNLAVALEHEALLRGAAIGYAVARTMPASLDELAAWPDRAAAFLGREEQGR